MIARKPVLVAAGDVGGARAVLPALYELERRAAAFVIVSHRSVAEEAPTRWSRITLPTSAGALEQTLGEQYAACVIGTSVADTLALGVARAARHAGLPVIAVLDNWMSYRTRLETDGLPMLVPDAYAVMDELSKGEAIASGVPEACLRITGHPALATLADEFTVFQQTSPAAPSGARRFVVFVSEPAEKDQGGDESSPRFRGYTEKTVLSLLARCLQPFHEAIEVGLVAHPRENAGDLASHWDRCRGKLVGGLMTPGRGRDAVFRADGVSGMSSLLLFEAHLLGKPVLSLQPGLRVQHLDFLRRKGVQHFVTDETAAPRAVRQWMETMSAPGNAGQVQDAELALHHRAPANLADLIQHFSG